MPTYYKYDLHVRDFYLARMNDQHIVDRILYLIRKDPLGDNGYVWPLNLSRAP
jgi:hypothetical protein